MRVDTKILLALLSFEIITISSISGLQIVPPYPPNSIVLEGESLTIPCSAADPTGYPSKVTFKTKSADGSTYEEIKTSERVSITNSTRNDTVQGVLTRTAVLHITNTRFPDDGDSQGMSYKCSSTLGRNTKELTFMVYLVKKVDLPRAVVKGTTATYGGSANLTCDVTYRGNPNTVQLKRVLWMRNFNITGQGAVDIAPIIVTKATTRDGGDYVCAAEVNLMATRLKQITMGTATLNVKVKMFNGTTQVIGKISGSVVMECPAEGYPLNVTWLRVNNNGQEVRLSDVPRIRDRYVVTRPCPSCRYRMTIYKLQSRDQGHYVCKASSNMASARHHCELIFPESKVTVKPTLATGNVTVKPTLAKEPIPKPSSRLPLVMYIILGIVLSLSLLLNGFLFYKLRRNKQLSQKSTLSSDVIPTGQPEDPRDSAEIISEPAVPTGDENSTTIELQPNADHVTNQSAEETEDHPEPSDTTMMIQESEGIATDIELQPIVDESEKEQNDPCCVHQDHSIMIRKEVAKYLEVPQHESPNTRNNSESYNCRLM